MSKAPPVSMRDGMAVIQVRIEVMPHGHSGTKQELAQLTIFFKRGEETYRVHATDREWYGEPPNYEASFHHEPKGEKGGLFEVVRKAVNALAQCPRTERRRPAPPGLSLKKAEALQRKKRSKKEGDG